MGVLQCCTEPSICYYQTIYWQNGRQYANDISTVIFKYDEACCIGCQYSLNIVTRGSDYQSTTIGSDERLTPNDIWTIICKSTDEHMRHSASLIYMTVYEENHFNTLLKLILPTWAWIFISRCDILVNTITAWKYGSQCQFQCFMKFTKYDLKFDKIFRQRHSECSLKFSDTT